MKRAMAVAHRPRRRRRRRADAGGARARSRRRIADRRRRAPSRADRRSTARAPAVALAALRRIAAHSRAARQADGRSRASGDPFFYGVGDLIARHVARDEIFCASGALGFLARGGAAQMEPAGLRAAFAARPRLRACRRRICSRARAIIALSWDETTPARLAAPSRRARHGRIAPPCARTSRRPAGARARRARRRLRAQ